jgi:type II secretory pathway component PulM
MSIGIQTGAQNQLILARQAEFRRQLDTLSSWQERAREIDERLKQTTEALATRNEKLLALRGDFNALTLDFWNAFERSLGCENPVGAIPREKARAASSSARLAILLTVTTILVLVIVWWQINGPSLWAVSFCLSGTCALYAIFAGPVKQIARARKVLMKSQASLL